FRDRQTSRRRCSIVVRRTSKNAALSSKTRSGPSGSRKPLGSLARTKIAIPLAALWCSSRAQSGRRETMGKAANNERAKLRAVFWNNLGVGVLLGAYFLPLFSLYLGTLPSDTFSRPITFVGLGLAVLIGIGLHMFADYQLNGVQD